MERAQHRARGVEELVIKTGVNTATFDVKGDAEKGPGKDKFGNTRGKR